MSVVAARAKAAKSKKPKPARLAEAASAPAIAPSHAVQLDEAEDEAPLHPSMLTALDGAPNASLAPIDALVESESVMPDTIATPTAATSSLSSLTPTESDPNEEMKSNHEQTNHEERKIEHEKYDPQTIIEDVVASSAVSSSSSSSSLPPIIIAPCYPTIPIDDVAAPIRASSADPGDSPLYPQSMLEPGLLDTAFDDPGPGAAIEGQITDRPQLSPESNICEERKEDREAIMQQSEDMVHHPIPSNAVLVPSVESPPIPSVDVLSDPVSSSSVTDPIVAAANTSIPLSVPSMLHEQMQARSLATAKVRIASVEGPLQSDALTSDLVQSHAAEMHAFGTWFERKAGALNGRFYELVEAFRAAQNHVSSTYHSTQQSIHACQVQLHHLWIIRTATIHQKQVCADGTTLEHNIKHAIAEFDVRAAEAAYGKLVERQQQGVQQLTSHRFLAQSNLLQVELFLSELLSSKGLFHPNVGSGEEGVSSGPAAASSSASSSSGAASVAAAPGGLAIHPDADGHTPGATPIAQPSPAPSTSSTGASSSAINSPASLDFLHSLRYCIDVLFFFEKYVDPAVDRDRALWKIQSRDRRAMLDEIRRQRALTEQTLSQQPNATPQPPEPHQRMMNMQEEDVEEEELQSDSPPASASSSSSCSPPSSPAASGVVEHEDSKFRSCIRRWLKLLVDALYTVGEYTDHLYVFNQVLRCRGVTRWASLIQPQRANHADRVRQNAIQTQQEWKQPEQNDEEDNTWAWTPQFVQYLLSAFTLILQPLDGKQLKFSISPGGPSSAVSSGVEHIVGGGGLSHLGEWSREKRAEEGESVRIANVGISPSPDADGGLAPAPGEHAQPIAEVADSASEWTLLDAAKLKNAANVDVSYRVSLNESDYTDILQNMPLMPFVRSRFYPLFLSLARRHVATHTAVGSNNDIDYDNAYESFDRQSLTQAFSQVKCLLDLLSRSLTRFPEYPQLSKFIAKQMCLIVGFISAAWARAWSVARGPDESPGAREIEGQPDQEPTIDHADTSGLYPYPCCYACHGFYALLQKELDFCMLRLICTIQHSGLSSIKFFLCELPFSSLSTEAAGQAFLILMNQSHVADYQDSSLSFTPLLLAPWYRYLATPPGAAIRANFTSLLKAHDGSYIHVLMALTKLCTQQTYEISPFVLSPIVGPTNARPRSYSNTTGGADDPDAHGETDDAGGAIDPAPTPTLDSSINISFAGYRFRSAITDLPLIYLVELFQISYLNFETREELFRPCQGFITSLCANHPLAISLLLFLCHYYFRFIGGGAIALFDTMDLTAWRPTASDMYILQALLLTPATAPSNELARCILTRINYNFAVTHERPELHGFASTAEGAPPSNEHNQQVRDHPCHLFFPPRSRAPLLGWQFHRSLLLMLADVRLASVRSTVLTSSLGSTSAPAPSAQSPPPPVPFTSFVPFPSCAFANIIAAANATRSRRTSSASTAQPYMPSTSDSTALPQPPSVEAHLQQQFDAQQRHSVSPPSAPAFSSASPPLPTPHAHAPSSAFSFASTASLTGFLGPASSALADVFGVSKKPIEPAWWIRILTLASTRDTDGSIPSQLPTIKTWLSQRYAVKGVDLDDYTNLVRRDPVLAYIQLQVSSFGSDLGRFSKEGWKLLRAILHDSTFQCLGYRAMHDILPNLIRGGAIGIASDSHTASPNRSPSWSMVQSAVNPPPFNLAASAHPHLASSMLPTAVGTPPRAPLRRPSAAASATTSTNAGHGNPFADHAQSASPTLHPASSSSASASFIAPPGQSLAILQSIGILHSILDQARPKGVFSVFQSKNITYDSVHLLSQLMSAHMLASMRSMQTDHQPTPLPSSASAAGPLHAIFFFWSTEIQGASMRGKANEPWSRDHNLRFLYDALCRTIIIWNNWITHDPATAILTPPLGLLFQFTGQQAIALATHGSSNSPNIGSERRNASYLQVNSSPPVNPHVQPPAGPNADEVELSFEFQPNVNPPKSVIESLLPPESLLTAFNMPPRDVLTRHPYAAFISLVDDTLADRSAWLKLGYMISRWETKVVLKASLKRVGIVDDRIRRNCMVRRWFTHALACPVECPLLPLFWQHAFRLMFARMHLTRPMADNIGGYFGFRFLTGTSGRILMQQCREQLNVLAQVFARRRLDAIQNNRGGQVLHPSVYQLPLVFTAMHSWLTAEAGVDPAQHTNSLRERLLGFGVTLPDEFMPSRLASILLPTADKHVPLWIDLVDIAGLRWEQFSEWSNLSKQPEFIPTPQLYSSATPASVEGENHTFFYNYYKVQNFDLDRYAPTPADIVAIIKRKKQSTSTSNPFSLSLPVDLESVFSASEFLSPGIDQLAGPPSDRARALSVARVVTLKKKVPSSNSLYWSAIAAAGPPQPVIGASDAYSGAVLQIPSILTSSIWDLLDRDADVLAMLKQSIDRFTDRYSRLTALDRQLIDFFPGLYRNENSEYTHQQACRFGMFGQSKCRGPVRFYFQFSRAIKIRQVEENIEAICTQMALCIDTKKSPQILQEINLSFCASLIAVQRLIQHILRIASEPLELSPALCDGQLHPAPPGGRSVDGDAKSEWQKHVVTHGVKWLFKLAQLDSPLAKLFPPAAFFLKSAISALTPLLVHPYVHSVDQQDQLLELLGSHTGLIQTLSPSIRPEVATDPNQFIHLFRIALRVRDEHGVTSAIVMNRFDIQRWCQTSPPATIRLQLFTLCSQQIREEEKQPRRRPQAAGTLPAAAAEVICNWYASAMSILITADFAGMFMPAVKLVLDDVRSFCFSMSPFVPPVNGHSGSLAPTWLHRLWHTLAGLPLHSTTWETFTTATQHIEQAMWEIRRAHTLQVKQHQSQPHNKALQPIITQSNLRLHSLLGDLLPTLMRFFVALYTATHPSNYPSATLDSASSSVVCSASSRVKKNSAWASLWQCFSGFMAPDPPSDQPNTPVPPSNLKGHAYIDAQQQAMLDAFIRIVSILASASRSDESWVLRKLWHTYTDQITVHAESPFLQLLHATIIRSTKLPAPVDPHANDAMRSFFPFSPIPSVPQLDFACWDISSADLTSFQTTLKQAIGLHESELKVLIDAEQQRRNQEFINSVQVARLNKKDPKHTEKRPRVRREDVRVISQQAGKVELVATFLSHLISVCNWSSNLQQSCRSPSSSVSPVDGMIDDAAHLPSKLGVVVAPPHSPHVASGMYAHATIESPYQLYEPSPVSDYATTLLVTTVHVINELPTPATQSPTAASSSSTGALILPHFQQLLSTLLHIDWIAVFLVRLPPEAFRMSFAEPHRLASTHIDAFHTDSSSSTNDVDPSIASPLSPLPTPDDAHSMGLTALDREVNSLQAMLEQVSEILYAERSVSRTIEEIAQSALVTSPSSASSSSSPPAAPAVRQTTLASLLANPLGGLVPATSSAQATSAAPSSSSSSASAVMPTSILPPQSPLPAAEIGPLYIPDTHGLIRPHFNPHTGQLLQRYVSDFQVDPSMATTPISRTSYTFHLMYRLCAPMPPIAYLHHPQSTSNRHFFVPIVLAMRKSRLFAEWLLSCFHGEDAPRPIMLEHNYTELAAALLAHLNDYHDCIQSMIGDEEFIPILIEYLHVGANLDARGVAVSAAVKSVSASMFDPDHSKLTLLAVAASCRSIIQLDKLAQFLEQVLQVWKDTRHNEVIHMQTNTPNNDAPDHWQTVSATLQVPEISFDDFITACLNNGSILTLHVVSVQQLMVSSLMLSNPYSAPLSVDSSAASSSALVPSQSSSFLDPMRKNTMPQPITHTQADSNGQQRPLDPKPIQKKIDQLLLWLTKTQVKESTKKTSEVARKGSAATQIATSSLDDDDIEPVKLLTVIRTLFEWQGSLVRGFLDARHLPRQPQPINVRWSNPILAEMKLYPDPFPLLHAADHVADQFQLLLLKWFNDVKSSSSVLSLIGLSNSPRYSPKFRLLLKAIHTYMMLHTQASSAATALGLVSGQVKSHKAAPLHFNWDANPQSRLPPTTRQAILNHFGSHDKTKPFLPHAPIVRTLTILLDQLSDPELVFLSNPQATTFVPLIYAHRAIEQIIQSVFENIPM